jgi:hypothetical protein
MIVSIMAHVLAKIEGVKVTDIKDQLVSDMTKHAEHGLHLKHVWQKSDDKNQVFFIFRTSDLDKARKFIEEVHNQVLAEDHNANLPQMTFLEET